MLASKPMDSSFNKMKHSIETVVGDLKPMLTEKYDFEVREK